jgi:hypothetical protein
MMIALRTIRRRRTPLECKDHIKQGSGRRRLTAEQIVRSALEAFKDSPQEQERISSAARELRSMQ